jgi:hypothetical protein
MPVNIHAGSGLVSGSAVMVTAKWLKVAGLMYAAGGLNVISSGGFAAVPAKNFNMINGSDSVRTMWTAG